MRARWIILADVHLGTPDTQFPGQDYTYTAALLRKAVEHITALKADRIVVVGDLVNMGTADDYALAAEILAPLSERLEPMIGNHELVEGSLADFERQFNRTATRALSEAPLPAFALNSGIEHLPMTQWHGVLGDAQLDWLRQQLDRAAGPALVFCHHPLNATVRRSTEPMMSLDDSDDLRAVLESHGHDVLLFTGHTHYQNIVLLGRITCIGCPPVAFWPHAMLVMDIDDNGIRISTERLIDTPARSPDAHAHDPTYRSRAEGTPADQTLSITLT